MDNRLAIALAKWIIRRTRGDQADHIGAGKINGAGLKLDIDIAAATGYAQPFLRIAGVFGSCPDARRNNPHGVRRVSSQRSVETQIHLAAFAVVSHVPVTMPTHASLR